MHTVGWLEFGEEERAANTFKMMLRNVNDPFKVTFTYSQLYFMLILFFKNVKSVKVNSLSKLSKRFKTFQFSLVL